MHPPTSKQREPRRLVTGLEFAHARLLAGAARLTMTGELDVTTASRAAVHVRRAQDESRVLICEISGLWFVDVTGLRVLVDAAVYARRTGRRLLVANAPPIVPRMLRLLGLEQAIEVPSLPLRTPAAPGCGSFRRHAS
jgi:anti-anti-sigma factor